MLVQDIVRVSVVGGANKQMVPTLPARDSFHIIARHTRLVVASASFRRSGRWHGRTFEALALILHTTNSEMKISIDVFGAL